MAKTLKMIVVEGDRQEAAGLAKAAHALGHEVCGVAHDVSELAALLGKHKPDLILLDLNLGVAHDGLGVATALEAAGPLPIVFVTDGVDDWQKQEIRALGTTSTLLKPVTSDKLEAAIKHALDRTREAKDATL